MALTIDTTITSPNHSDRPQGTAIDMIVLHTGEGSKQSDLRTLCNAAVPMADRVSAHFYVDRLGQVYQLVDPKYEAWHAGASSWLGRDSLAIRRASIGIESEHKAGQTWPSIQRAAYADLCRYLISRYPIQPQLVVAHRWIAPARRSDPTDWPDAELKPWIAGLFDLAALWGPIATPRDTQWEWDSVKVWRANWRTLGACRSHLLYDNDNHVITQAFEHGMTRQDNGGPWKVYLG